MSVISGLFYARYLQFVLGLVNPAWKVIVQLILANKYGTMYLPQLLRNNGGFLSINV